MNEIIHFNIKKIYGGSYNMARNKISMDGNTAAAHVSYFFGYTHESGEKFWNMALKMYLGTEDEAVCQAVAEKAMIIGYTRMLRRAARRPDEADSPAKIARCKEMLAILLDKVDTLTF